MWCPRCQTEVPEDLLTCPACGAVPEQPQAPDAPAAGGAAFDVGVCRFADAASCGGAIALLESAGIPCGMVRRAPHDAGGGAEYWVAVGRRDARRAGEVLRSHLAIRCALCGEPLAPEDTVCAGCGEPRR